MAQGIGLAGGYGAGGAGDALVELLKRKFLETELRERQRANVAEEQHAAATLTQRKSEATSLDERAKADRAEAGRTFAAKLGLDRDKLSEDTRQFGVTSGENARQFDTGLEFKKGEAGRDQENKNRGFGLDERKLTEEERSNREAASISRSRVGSAGSNRTVKISYSDPETGQVFEEYVTPQEARERGPMRKGMTTKDLDAGNAMTDYVKKIDDALALGDKSGWAGTGFIVGRTAGAFGGKFASEDALNLRGLIGDLFAENAHERFGGALTTQEIARAKAYLAEATDDPKKIKVNLQRMRGVVMPALERWQARKGASAPSGGDAGQDAGQGQQFDFDPKTGALVPRGGRP
jgi:hypothetical protein